MFLINKKKLVIVSVLLICVFTIIFCFGALSYKSVIESTPDKFRVVIDAGHGGIDCGVVGINSNIKESELNLSVAKKLEELIIASGMNAYLTRSSDAGLYGIATKNLKRKDMEKRKEIIESVRPDVVISIHMNYFSVSSRRGAQVFYKSNDENGEKLAKEIQSSFNLLYKDVKDYKPLVGDYYILNCSEYPSVICECGFLSNAEDEKLLISQEYQNELAYTIFKGIVNYSVSSTFSYNY